MASGQSLHEAVRVSSYKEFAQVTGKVFEFNNDFRHIAPSQFALNSNNRSNQSQESYSSGGGSRVRTRTAPAGANASQRHRLRASINLEA